MSYTGRNLNLTNTIFSVYSSVILLPPPYPGRLEAWRGIHLFIPFSALAVVSMFAPILQMRKLKLKEGLSSPSVQLGKGRTGIFLFFFGLSLFAYWSIVDLQHCVNFWYMTKWLNIYILFHYSLLHVTEYSSLCYRARPCCFSILYIVPCIC